MKKIINIRSTNIKNIINAGVFVTVILLVVNNITWIYRGNGAEAREEIIGFENIKEDIDVVTIGSSNLLRYYMPLQAYSDFGFTSYNYATSGGEMNLLKYYIEEVKKYQSPRLYVVNVGCILYMDKMSEAGLRNWSDSLDMVNITRCKGIGKFLSDFVTDKIDVLSYYFDLAKYHIASSALGDAHQYELISGDYNNVDKGFAPYLGIHPFDTPKPYYQCEELTELEYRTMMDLLDYCEEEGINVLFILNPFYITKENWFKINTISKMIEGRGFEFVNFNEYYDEIGLDFVTDYYDNGHVNYVGAEKFTRFFANYLNEKYELPDHRGDVDFRSWDNDVEVFAKSQLEWKTETENNIDSVIASRDKGNLISGIFDFDDWYEAIMDDNYSLLIAKRGEMIYPSKSYAFLTLMKETGVELDKKYYAGVYSGKKLFAENSNEVFVNNEGSIGISGDTRLNYSIVSGKEGVSIIIDGVEYLSQNEGIQIVVFDNNFMRVYDTVTILSDESGDVVLKRL